MSDTTEFDNKYALYELDEDDDDFVPGLLEAVTAAIDEFIATLTDSEVNVAANSWDDSLGLVDRALAFARERGVDPDRLGFSDTASREAFHEVAHAAKADEPTVDDIAEMLINGNISAARDAIVLNRTATEAVVFALDVVGALAIRMSADPDPMEALLAHERAVARLRRCVNRG